MRQNARSHSMILKRMTKMKMLADFRFWIRWSAGKRFAYIGESDHFIHEKYAYRLAILNYLAARGFTHVGEEDRRTDGMRIERYIETGDESQLERVSIYGYSGAARSDRDDTPTGILRGSFGDAYPTALFAAEQKRFAHGLRKISQRLEAADSGSRLHFLGFDIDPLPGGGYEDLAEILESMPADADNRSDTGMHRSASKARRLMRKSRGSTMRSDSSRPADSTRYDTRRPAFTTVSIMCA